MKKHLLNNEKFVPRKAFLKHGKRGLLAYSLTGYCPIIGSQIVLAAENKASLRRLWAEVFKIPLDESGIQKIEICKPTP